MAQPSTLHPNAAPVSLMEVLVAHGTSREDAAEVVEFITARGLGDELVEFLAAVERLYDGARLAAHMCVDPEEPEFNGVSLYIASDLDFEEAYSKLNELRAMPLFAPLRGHVIPLLN